MAGRIFFVYSSGRNATQWLTAFFARNLGDSAVVDHEPIRFEWRHREALRHSDLAGLRRQLPEVDAHLARIAKILDDGRDYVETGWPAHPWFPYLLKLFGDRFGCAHIVRNPLYVAGSHMTHGLYRHPDRPLGIHPTDGGVAYPEFAREWGKFNRFEKCLYHWLEINRHGIDVAQAATAEGRSVPVFKFENLFCANPESLVRLYREVGRGDPDPASLALPPIDKFIGSTSTLPLVHSTGLWNEVAAVAERLGYSAQEIERGVEKGRVWKRYSDNSRGTSSLSRKVVRSINDVLLAFSK